MAKKRKFVGLPIVLLFLIIFYNHANKAEHQSAELTPATVETQVTDSQKPINDLEIPSRLYNREEQIIRHTGYTVSYNDNWRIPNWVAYELTLEKTLGTVKRSNKFVADPLVDGVETHTSDYSNSGYDRGHMAPAADMKCSEKPMRESFYLSNICPQLHNLNAGDWKELEEKGRDWAQEEGSIFIVCGPIVSETPNRNGVTKIAVPDAFFKVFLCYGKQSKAIGFIMPHKKGSHPLHSYAMSIDEVEEITGIDFFPNLPNEQEEELEAMNNPSAWGL